MVLPSPTDRLPGIGMPTTPVTAPDVTVPARVLVADDQADVVEAVRLLLKLEGYQVDGVGSPGAVLAAVERGGDGHVPADGACGIDRAVREGMISGRRGYLRCAIASAARNPCLPTTAESPLRAE